MVKNMMTVLIADDEDLARYTIKLLISRNYPGLDVIAEAADGDEAVRLAKDYKPDLAVLDIRMPVLDGLETARKIRNNNPETAILILTAYEDFSSAQQAVNAGVNGYLLKPVTPEAFADRLESIRKWREGLKTESSSIPEEVSGEDQTVSWRLKRAMEHIQDHLSKDLPMNEVADTAGISSQHLSRLFRDEMNTSFIKVITEKRMDRARKLLVETTLGVAEIAKRCGYRNANYFAKVFRKNWSISPRDYRNSINLNPSPIE